MKYVLFIATCVSVLNTTNAQRVKYNFNSDWKVFIGDTPAAKEPGFKDAGWKSVTLPYAWNEDEAFKKHIAEHSDTITWYRKRFSLPVTAKGLKVFIEFEGIRQAGDFYVNGNPVGFHENGVTSFGFDITEFVRFGNEENVIAARIDNNWDYRERSTNQKYQWEDRNFNANYGGISKNVFLHVTGKLYQTLPLYSNLQTTGVYVYASDINVKARTATIHTESEVKNETGQPQQLQYEVKIFDLENKLVKSITGETALIAAGETKIVKAFAPVNGLNFWSWGYGYLYTIETILKLHGKTVDVVKTKTGFRKTAFQNGMIYLNERVIQVKGYAQRSSNEWPAIGLSVPAWLSDYSNRLIIESNGNLVRWMHITPWKQDIESCDRIGLMQAMPAGDAERDVEGQRWEQRKQVMRDAIIYNKNNPSIIFYECGNESISEKHMKEMKAIRDQYDPQGGRAIGSREMLNSREAEYGGEMLYINKSARIPMWATEYSRDEGLRKYWDDYSPPYHKDGDGPLYRNLPAKEYNRNQESHAIENVARWYDYWKERPGTGSRVSSGGVNIIFSESNTHQRGAENYRRSGEVDALRIKKENYYAHQVMWDGWVDVKNTGIHIIGHWNYQPGVVKDMFVVAAADKVKLFVNGKSMGFGEQSKRFLFTFKKIPWQAGTITAVGYTQEGKKVSTTQKTTSGEPVALRLKPMTRPGGMLADGHDLALIEVEAIDAKGNRCPIAMNMVHITLSGPAEWRGGMAQGPDNYILSRDLPLECGVNRVLIRSTTKNGLIGLMARAEGLNPASITLLTKSFPTVNGLTTTLTADGLKPNLEKGPTPLTPSYTITRNAVRIVKAIAGARSDSAFASYDDNELSDWVNDGQLTTAWVEYELEKDATVTEVSMKLNNFRSRSYPLLITLDGKELFRDSTQRGLGYYTAVCSPQTGRKLKIQLLQPSTLVESKSTEVAGQKPDDGVSRNDANAKRTLSIIELEVYEAVKPQQ